MALAKLAAPRCFYFDAHASSISGLGFCKSDGLKTLEPA